MHELGKNSNMATFMSCHKLVCFPVALSNKIGMFILYGNMWKNLASDVLLCFLANGMKLFFWKDAKKFKIFCNAGQEEIFHTREKHIFYTSAELNTWL